MKNLRIRNTKSTPLVITKDSTLQIKGISIPEHAPNFYEPISKWISNHFKNHEKLYIVLKLHYLNSASMYSVKEVLRISESEGDIEVHWFYEADDGDIYETGHMLSEMCKNPFIFHEVEEIFN